MTTKRDWLDYLDFAIKTIGGGILFVLTTYLHESNDLNKAANALKQQEIDNTMRFGVFAQSMIKDLLVQDQDSSKLKTDLTFITLNRTIGDKDTILIGELGARMIKDYYKAREQADTKSIDTVAYEDEMATVANIVKDRDTIAYIKAMGYRDAYNSWLYKKLQHAVYLKANKSTKPANGAKTTDTESIAENIPDKSWAQLTLIPSKATVFIQVNKTSDSARVWANDLRAQLNNKGFNAPGIEMITKYPFYNSILYYYDADKAAADKIKNEAKDILKIDMVPKKLTNSKVHRGTIELWVNY